MLHVYVLRVCVCPCVCMCVCITRMFCSILHLPHLSIKMSVSTATTTSNDANTKPVSALNANEQCLYYVVTVLVAVIVGRRRHIRMAHLRRLIGVQ